MEDRDFITQNRKVQSFKIVLLKNINISSKRALTRITKVRTGAFRVMVPLFDIIFRGIA